MHLKKQNKTKDTNTTRHFTRKHLTFGAGTHVGQTRWGYFCWLGWKEANNSALSQAAHTQKCLHTQRRWDYFGKNTSLLLCFMGQRGGGEGGGGGEEGSLLFFGAVLRYGGPVCVLVRKEAAVRSIHPLRRFPAECDVRAGKWAGSRILGLLWIWHELGPRLLWTWWMYYLIFLSLLTSSWKGRRGHSVCVCLLCVLGFGEERGGVEGSGRWGWVVINTSSLAVFGFWWSVIMTLLTESRQWGPFLSDQTKQPTVRLQANGAAAVFWAHDSHSNKQHCQLIWPETNL